MYCDWSEQQFGDLTENLDSIRVPIKQTDRVPGQYPYFGASGIVDHVDDYLFDGEYLLIAEDGENLRTRNTPIAFLAEGKFWVNNHAHVVRGNHRADTQFLKYALSAMDIGGYLTGSTFPKLTQKNLNSVPVLTPPLPEQRTIAHILGSLDDKFELNRRIIETLEAMARALFKSWFIDFDPVHAKAAIRNHDSHFPTPQGGVWNVELAQAYLDRMDPAIVDLFPDAFVESDLGEIPEGWEVLSLDEIVNFQNGLALQRHRPLANEERLPVLKITQLRSGYADSGEWASANIRPECIINDGDIVFSWSGSLMVKIWCGGPAALNQHLFRLSSTQYPKWFYLHSVLYHLPDFQHIAAGKATTMGHIKRHHLSDALCVVPNRQIFSELGSLPQSLLERRTSIEIQSRSYVALRDALLPVLISGKMRIDANMYLNYRRAGEAE